MRKEESQKRRLFKQNARKVLKHHYFVLMMLCLAAIYVLVPLIDTALSHANTKALSAVCMVLVVTFAADMVYSHYVPNTGEGITDYKAYKESNAEELYEQERQTYQRLS